ncbi:MAG: hypothetical protein HY565_03935 [Candidatus Kerfeldbacteria bacterium]|nr:hypothetical protein [Candidatus Kerfeldbacteria bacterium]
MTFDYKRLVHWQLAGLGWSCLITVLATVSTGLAVIIGIVVAMFVPLPADLDDWRFVGGLIVGVLLNCLLLVAIAVVVVVMRQRKLNTILQVFNANFRSSFLGQRQQTEITVEGMPVNVLLQKGPMLTLSIPVHTGVKAGLRNLVYGQLPTWEQLTVQSSDAVWLEQWSKPAQTRHHLLQLLQLQSQYEVRTVTVLPELLTVQLYRFPLSTLTADAAQQLVTATVALAKAAQAVTPSRTPVQMTALDKTAVIAMQNPSRLVGWVLLGLLAILIGGGMFVALLVFLSVLLSL